MDSENLINQELCPRSQCTNWLNFGPRRNSGAHKIGLALNGQMLLEAPYLLNYQNPSPQVLAQALKEAYGEWGVGELSRLVFHPQAPVLFQAPEFMAEFFAHPEKAQETLEKLSRLPLSFQNWCDEKKCSIQDLAILRSLDSVSLLTTLSEKIASSRLSKSQGVQVLEWSIELILLSHDAGSLLLDADEDTWLEELRKKRYPQTVATDEKSRAEIERLPWPKKTEVKWQRRGDRAQLELKLQTGSPEELEKQIEALQKAVIQWRLQGDSWT